MSYPYSNNFEKLINTSKITIKYNYEYLQLHKQCTWFVFMYKFSEISTFLFEILAYFLNHHCNKFLLSVVVHTKVDLLISKWQEQYMIWFLCTFKKTI